MSAVKLVAVFAENKLGQMARVTKVLADAGVNIRWMTIATSETFGVIKFLVDQCDRAFQALKDAGFTASLVEVLAIEIEDQPGAFHELAETLSRHQVNVQNSSGMVVNRRAILLIEVRDPEQARAALSGQGLRLLTQEEAVGL
jgi:hypothetical protein